MDIESGNFKIESLEALLFFNKLFFFFMGRADVFYVFNICDCFR